MQIRGPEFPEQLQVGSCCAGSFWAGYRMCSWQHWLTSSPPFPWNPHLGISWQHHQLKLRSPCPWALCGTQLSPGLVEPLPQFPLCETRCHLSATLVSSTFGPTSLVAETQVCFGEMDPASPASVWMREGGRKSDCRSLWKSAPTWCLTPD